MKYINILIIGLLLILGSCNEPRDLPFPQQANSTGSVTFYITEFQELEVSIDDEKIGDLLFPVAEPDCEADGLRIIKVALSPGGYSVLAKGIYVEEGDTFNVQVSDFLELREGDCQTIDMTFYQDNCFNCRTR